MIRTTTSRPIVRRTVQALLLTASATALAQPASAMDVLFSSREGARVTYGQRVSQADGVTQIRLDSGAVLSFVEGADYRINEDGSVDLYAGGVTVAGGEGGPAIVRMPEGVEGRVSGMASAASFTVAADGTARGHALTGQVQVLRGTTNRTFNAGELWAAAGRQGLRRVMSNGEQAAPGTALADGSGGSAGADDGQGQVADLGAGGPLAAAENGLPVSLGDALAAAGAAADIVGAARRVELAAGNPDLDTFPSGDLAQLVSYAAQLERAHGGTPFPAARADIIRSYLGWLANGRAGADFLSGYSTIMVQYLDLLRAGGLPSSFRGSSRADLEAWLAYAQRTNRFAALSSQNRVLVDAYLAFLSGGGNPDQFSRRYTDLVNAYFVFLRGGGDAVAFAGASQQTLDSYIRFLNDSGLSAQLAAADRQLLAAYLANGGLAFTSQYRTALGSYYEFLRAGNLPSAYRGLDGATLRNYLEALQSTGLFDTVLGAQAEFYAAYLAHLRSGGAVDGFAGLNANIFAGYTTRLNAYYAFLAAGNLPSAYAGDLAALRQYLEALDANGALAAFLGSRSSFYTAYLAHLRSGGTVDGFAGLNANVFAGYTVQLNAYYDYLLRGGAPSAYTQLTQQQIAAYVEALRAAGASGTFLTGLAEFYTGYAAYLAGGGNPDVYTGLPVLNLPAFAEALNAYAAWLAGGGLPSGYSGLPLATLNDYIDALARSGRLADLLGTNASLLTAYFTYLDNGGALDRWSGLPVYANYVSALQAYYAYLQGGGLPGGYSALTQAQIQAYLAALSNAGGLGDQLGSLSGFFTGYYAFVVAGGNPANYSGIPAYASYADALRAYYAYLAGGGLPSGYAALTQEQVRAYLAALNAAGGFTLQLGGDLSAFFTDYFAFVSGGGNAANYARLPVYSTYVSALQAYYTYLQGGGLPSGYTALSQAQIQAYLAALQSAGGFSAQLGTLSTFFSGYYTFVAGGGNPGSYGGLPLYANYASALTAYYTYLQGGGSPSAYTGLTQAQIQLYLQALSDAGVLSANFAGTTLSFFTSYLTYLGTGANPDQFAALPSRPVTLAAGARAWMFSPTRGLTTSTTSAQVTADGKIEKITGAGDNQNVVYDYTTAANTLREYGRFGGTVAWSRYQQAAIGSVTNVQEHVLLLTPAVNVPNSGNTTYALVGGTAPSDAYAAAGTIGHMTGSVAVAFGAAPRLGADLSVRTGTRGWRLTTNGGATNPATGMAINTASWQFGGSMTVTNLAGDACSATCGASISGSLAGDGAGQIGLHYNINEGGAARSYVNGIGVFSTTGTALSGIGTLPPAPPVTPPAAGGSSGIGYSGGFNPTSPRISFITTLRLSGSNMVPGSESGFEATAYTLNSGGGLTAYTRTGGTTRTSGSTTVTDVSGTANALIGRWTSGTNTGANPFTLTANQGLHYFLARPVAAGFALPTSGTIHYDLIAATRPTIVDGSVAPGTFTGDLAIVLGTAPKVALEAKVAMNDSLIRTFATTGGIANPTQSTTDISFNTAGGFTFVAQGSNANGCTPTSCAFTASGNFAGDRNALAIMYTASDAGGSAKSIIGTALFGNGTLTGAAGAPQVEEQAAADAAPQALAVAPWDRWGSETPSVAGTAVADVAAAPGIEALAASGITFTPEQLQLLAQRGAVE